MNTPLTPARKHKRVPMAVPAFYDCESPANGEKEIRLSEGTVRDFSHSGICLFASAPLNRGESIMVFCDDIWSAGKSGTVLWCNRMDLRLFRVGICLQ